MKNSLNMSQRLNVVRGLVQAALLMAVCSANAFADANIPNAFVGSWSVQWTGAAAKPVEGNLTINAKGQGTWQSLSKTKNSSPCVGREVPISVADVTDKSITVKLMFEEVLKGCGTPKITMEEREDKSMTGVRDQFVLTYIRK